VRARAEPELTLQTDAPEWAVRLNARAYSQPLDTRDRSELSADGSFAAAELGPVVASVSAVDRWWGPSLAASPVLGNAATPVPTLMLRRASEAAPEWEPMTWLGPWSWELSFGLPPDADPSGTNVFGFRLAARPAQGLELGLSRYLYWGGDGRPSGFGSLLRAIFGRSNIDDPTVQGPDPSNELAGFDLRYSVALPQATLVGWAHLIGEDEAGALPSKYFGTFGLQFGHMAGAQRLQWSVEGTDTRLRSFFGLRDSDGAAYSHGAFASGHYNRGLAVGAPMGGGGQQAAVTLDWIPIEDPNALRGQVRLWTAQLARDGSQAINVANLVPGNQRGALVQAAGRAQLAALARRPGLAARPGRRRQPVGRDAAAGLAVGSGAAVGLGCCSAACVQRPCAELQ
jgi:Capsule assembly protein Wzi